jgi:hypothetical protein
MLAPENESFKTFKLRRALKEAPHLKTYSFLLFPFVFTFSSYNVFSFFSLE